MKNRSFNQLLLTGSWRQLTDDPGGCYTNKWICDELWFRILNMRFPNLSGAFCFHRTSVVQSISVLAGKFDELNTNRIYHKTFKIECPYEGRSRNVHFFYCHKKGQMPSDISASPLCAYYNQNQNKPFMTTVITTKLVCGNSTISVRHSKEGELVGGQNIEERSIYWKSLDAA